MKNEEATEASKLASLRELLTVVQANTKKQMTGKQGNLNREERLLATHMEILLGRKPDAVHIEQMRY